MTTKSRWRTTATAVAVVALAAGILGAMPANAEETGVATTASPAEEQYRPYLHFSPERNWMNDPNGLVYEDGTWHLFFQHNPHGTRWGNMSWGHATSTDLVHWEEQPLAIPQTFDENGVAIEDIFSGSVVVDEQNTSGFGTAENPPMVAIYTSAYTPAHPTHAGIQAQSLAYSTDHGLTWTKYDGNPVLDRGSANFRDPKVFRYTDPDTGESYWVMVAVEALQYQVVLSRSDDLKTWTHLSDFGPANATGGIWECPDLFPLAVDGDPANTKWVLVVNLNPGSVAGGSGGQYFVGEFDGTTFTSESTVSDASLPPGDVFAGFNDGTYEGWTVANEPGNWANGPWTDAPATGTLPGQNPVTGFIGAGLVNGFADHDWPVGSMESPTFTIDRDHVNLLVGGGNHPHVDGTQLGNEPPAGRLLFDGFEFADGTTLADTGWQVTGDFATEPWRNPSTAGGDYVIGAKRLNTWEGGPKGDDNLGDLTSPSFTIGAGRGPPLLPPRRRQAVQRHARGAAARRRRGRAHGHRPRGRPAQLAVMGRLRVRGARRAVPGARRRDRGLGSPDRRPRGARRRPGAGAERGDLRQPRRRRRGRAHRHRPQQRDPRLGELGRVGVHGPRGIRAHHRQQPLRLGPHPGR